VIRDGFRNKKPAKAGFLMPSDLLSREGESFIAVIPAKAGIPFFIV
jgi:hypothetical protein